MKAAFFFPAGALALAACLGVATIAGIGAGVGTGAGAADRTPSVDWKNVRGDAGGMRHSPLTQISRENVKQLQVAWTYHTGDAQPGRRGTIECTPVVVDGVMYITTVKSKVVALDAATGQAKWTFDPYSAEAGWNANAMNGVNRGVAYWKDEKTGRGRIFHGTSDGRLFALDAATGALADGFAAKGILALREGIAEGRDISKRVYGITSAPAVFEDLVIAGFAVDEGPGASLPGDVRAFDARTGKERWRFHTVPRPGEFGHDSWSGDAWKDRGGVNAWSGLTVDESRGLVFAGLGSAAFDFYGGDRPGDNLFANSTVALDARTGQRKWHFQTTRHDIWDMDLPTPPVLVTVTHNGRKIDAAVQLTKTGLVYVFDRATGKPLFPIEERAVPPSAIEGERAAKSQPVPSRPPALVRQTFTEQDLSTRTPEVAAELRERFRGYKPGSTFTPPSLEGTVTIPGLLGGANWSGASFDPASGLLFVNVNNLPYVLTIKKADAGALYPWAITGYNHFRDRDGYPAVAPPWGLLVAVDLNAGEIKWKKTLGSYPELAKQGLTNTGTENIGGTIVTAGGLVFIGATKDEKFRAFDSATGEVLWEHQLEAGGYATPATYSVNGRQFVVIAAGGGGKMATNSGDAFVAFALPASTQSARN